MEEVVRERSGAGRPRAQAWTGVVFALALDLKLREVSGSTKSLDDVLDSVGVGPVTLAEFGTRVDAVAGQPIFEALLTAHRNGRAFAPVEKLLASLGVRRSLGEVSFESAPLAAAREALTLKLPKR